MEPLAPAATLDPDARSFSPEVTQALLRACLVVFIDGLRKAARTSIETVSDLFEAKQLISDQEALEFHLKREEWLDQFCAALTQLVERRLEGNRRLGRRPDPDVSIATLRVLNAFDQEKQAALSVAVRKLHRRSRAESDPLDLRACVLFDQPLVRELDNPFGPDYIVDALGMSARALFPNPRLWRPFMERVLSDITPAIPKVYITLNRLLAERGVLPDIKAALRARSALRPADDRDLLPLFSRLMHEAGSNIESINIEVPAVLGDLAASPATAPDADAGAPPTGAGTATAAASATPADSAGTPASGSSNAGVPRTGVLAPPTASSRAAVAATASLWPATAPTTAVAARACADANPFPSLDPMLALGASSPVFAVLEQWQAFDPQNEATRRDLSARGVDTGALPLNRIPYIRVAMGERPVTPTDKITMDVISLLFDYIFRDPSIPESTRGIFGRLQVPILKAALLDRGFFSDKKQPARRLLDRLAAGATGSTSDEAYRTKFEGVATRVVEAICKEFQLDVAVFERADQELRTFIAREQRVTTEAIGPDVEAALEVEASETDRAHARALVRDRLAGLRLPIDVRSFAESVWAEYLTLVSPQQGEKSDAYEAALQTLDDLLWSITAKERTAQKARLTKMVPGIIAGLRKACAALAWREERTKAFFDTLYQLHIAAIKTKSKPAMTTAAPAPTAAADATAKRAPVAPGAETVPASSAEGTFGGTNNYHDYVSEMIVGTWVAFRTESDWINARLAWISPLRTKYIFTTRSRVKAFVYAPEDLAWELGVGNARLVAEPVPLFDRAVSAALDSIAASKVTGAAAAATLASSPA